MPPHDHSAHTTALSPNPDALTFLSQLFNGEGFLPRIQCGAWTPFLLRMTVLSDLLIWLAYLAIPFVLFHFLRVRRTEIPFRRIFLLFGLFIALCGTTHLMEVVMFTHPIYRLAAVIKALTAIVSVLTVLALFQVIPVALAMRSPEQLQKEVDERTAQLQESNRIKDEFLASLSHELRTPLSSIIGWVYLLRNNFLSPQETQDALDSIDRSAKIQERLVEDVLDVSRSITGKLNLVFKEVEFRSLVEASVAYSRPSFQAKGVYVTSIIPDEDFLIYGDDLRLQQILWNLLSNAIKFTPNGGTVTLTLSREDDNVCFQVSDSGMGISPNNIHRIFERFYQVSSSSLREHGGLGLGLSLVKNLVDLHGGTILAKSEGEGMGTTFDVCFPLLTEAANNSDK